MRLCPLQLVHPPSPVQVRDADGALRRALLVARRHDRCFLQVTRGPGDNVLRWLPSSHVRAAGNADDDRHLGT